MLSRSLRATGRVVVLRIFAAACAAALVVLGLSPVARAAAFDAVDPSSVVLSVCPSDPTTCSTVTPGTTSPESVTQWVVLRMDMTWKAPEGARSGDTFTVTVGEPFSAYSGTFDLTSEDGTAVGSCSSEKSSGTVTCTLNDYADSHENVGGKLWFAVQASELTDATTTQLVLGSTTAAVPSPRVGAYVDPAGDTTDKGGWVLYPGAAGEAASLRWQVRVSSEDIPEGSGITLTDELSGSQSFEQDSLLSEVALAATGEDLNSATAVPADLYSLTVDDSRHLTIHLPDAHAAGLIPAGTAYQYRVRYSSTPDDATDIATGTYWTNSVTGGNVSVSAKSTYSATGGGTGSGNQSGNLMVAKSLQGATAEDAGSRTFPVHATYTVDGQQISRDLDLAADGTPAGLTGLPVGTVVTLTESPVDIDGYTFTDSAFSAATLNDAITISDGGHTATVTIVYGTLRLNLANTYEKVTTPPSEEPTTPPTEEPTTPPTEEPSPTPTDGPSTYPTEEPSTTPTEEPSSTPTEEPSSTPSETPSAYPTDEPPTTPTTPTEEPSEPVTPTTTPATPSEQPSTPAEEPSTPAPSTEPSGTPSGEPSSTPATPSQEPSGTPSGEPSSTPATPSTVPSTAPGTTPSAEPSTTPSPTATTPSSHTPGTSTTSPAAGPSAPTTTSEAPSGPAASSAPAGGIAQQPSPAAGPEAGGQDSAAPTSSATPSGGRLPRTGADVGLLLGGAAALIGVGLLLYGIARRRA